MALADYFTDDTGLYGAVNQGEDRELARQKAADEAAFLAQSRPYDIQQKAATAASTQATADKIGLENDFTRNQMPNKINKANSDFGVDMDTNRIKMMGGFGQKLATIGALLRDVPPPARLAAFQKFVADNGINLRDNPAAQQFLNTDPNELPGLLSNMGRNMIFSSADFITKQAQQKQQDDAAMARQKYSSDSSAGASRYAADAGLKRAEMTAQGKNDFITSLRKAADPVKQYSMLVTEAKRLESIDPDTSNLYTQMALQVQPAAEAKIKSATPGSADLGGMGIDTVPAPNISPPSTPKTSGRSLNSLPQGARQIGTSGGKPVYQTPDGKRFIGE